MLSGVTSYHLVVPTGCCGITIFLKENNVKLTLVLWSGPAGLRFAAALKPRGHNKCAALWAAAAAAAAARGTQNIAQPTAAYTAASMSDCRLRQVLQHAGAATRHCQWPWGYTAVEAEGAGLRTRSSQLAARRAPQLAAAGFCTSCLMFFVLYYYSSGCQPAAVCSRHSSTLLLW